MEKRTPVSGEDTKGIIAAEAHPGTTPEASAARCRPDDPDMAESLQRLFTAAGYVDENLLARFQELTAENERLFRENRRLRGQLAGKRTDHTSTRLREALRE